MVYGLEYGALVGGPIGTSPYLPTVALKAAHDVTNEGVERAERRASGIKAEGTTLAGRAIWLLVPVAAILGEARHAGMIVVGARGRGAVAGLLLGSVSQRVMHGASCPVTVVRTEQPPPAASSEPATAHATS